MSLPVPEGNRSQLIFMRGRVLGIDPGLNVTGYAVIESSPRGPCILEAGVIRPGSASSKMAHRLLYIHRAIVEVLEAFTPGSIALEQIHSHVRYPRTAILMAHARGTLILAAAQYQTPVFGYAATRIKKTITGNGRAPKAQIQHAIMTELGLSDLPKPHDVADACAVALCHFYISRIQSNLMD